jgi:hypothetical protein
MEAINAPTFPRSAGVAAVFLVVLGLAGVMARGAETSSDPAHKDTREQKPLPWPNGAIPYDISKLTDEQATNALGAMKLWMATGANLKFIPRTTEIEYINFTGKTDAGNNTTFIGFRPGMRLDINITTFWWRQGEWMPAHELGHVLGFFHGHQRWDRDRYVTIMSRSIMSISSRAANLITTGFQKPIGLPIQAPTITGPSCTIAPVGPPKNHIRYRYLFRCMYIPSSLQNRTLINHQRCCLSHRLSIN